MTVVMACSGPTGYAWHVRFAYLISVWLHVLAAMTWVGGMLTFVAAAMPWARRQGEEQKTTFLHDFSGG
jgi:uncharacterized membrane protein